MNKQKVAVVIPFYHSDLSELEIISLEQCVKILHNYTIILLVPENMPERDYPQYEDLIYKKISSDNLRSVSSYNKMMLTQEFYHQFEEYEYILIYQLDAFVFDDRLEYFCDLGFDYIGAPWITGLRYYKNSDEGVMYVGNGGFSLRKVASFIDLLGRIDTSGIEENEDVFFAKQKSDSFKIAPKDVALNFAFEQNVEKCYKLNNDELPFGCHAWEKHNFEFWKPFLEKEGYKIKTNVIGNLDIVMPPVDYTYLACNKKKIFECLKRNYDIDKRRVCIFGAGIKGEECGCLLRKIGISDFDYYDNNADKLQKELWGKKVQLPEECNKVTCDDLIIVTVKKYEKEIIRQLEGMGYLVGDNIVSYREITEILLSEC